MKFLGNAKVALNIAIIIVALSISYFLVVAANIQKREANNKDLDRAKFESCLSLAFSEYMNQWNFQCVQSKKPENCTSLSGLASVGITNQLREDKLNCAKLYK
jgi:hypothetical protein